MTIRANQTFVKAGSVVDIVPSFELEQAYGGSGNLSAVILPSCPSRSPEAAPELSKEADVEMTPIPGIILPRDAGGRIIMNDMASALPEPDNDLDREFVNDVAESLGQELTGYVNVSTGEHFDTKPVRFDWVNFKKT